MLRKRLIRWLSSCFICLFHRKSLLFPMYCRCWSGRMWRKHSYVHTPAFFNTGTHHLKLVDVAMRLWDLTKLIKRFWSFRRFLVFSIYCSRWLSTQISWSGCVKMIIGSRWCPGRDCFNNSGTKIVILSASNFIKSMFLWNNVWSLWPVVIHRRIARRYERIFKSHFFKALIFFIYLRTTNTSHEVEYFGRAGYKLKTLFKNLHNKANSPNGMSFSVLIIVDKTNLVVFTDK